MKKILLTSRYLDMKLKGEMRKSLNITSVRSLSIYSYSLMYLVHKSLILFPELPFNKPLCTMYNQIIWRHSYIYSINHESTTIIANLSLISNINYISWMLNMKKMLETTNMFLFMSSYSRHKLMYVDWIFFSCSWLHRTLYT